MKKVSLGNLVNQIVDTAGVSKQNAQSIVNIFTNAWASDPANFIKAVHAGIPVGKARKASSAKKASTAKKTSTTKKSATTSKVTTTKKTTTAKKNTVPAVVEGKKPLKKKLKTKVESTQENNSVDA